MEVIIDRIETDNRGFHVYLSDGVRMVFSNVEHIQAFIDRPKENPALRGAFEDILTRDPGLQNPQNVLKWKYVTRKPSREVLP